MQYVLLNSPLYPQLKLYADVDRLFHVVYNENYTQYQIYDSSLCTVDNPVGLVENPKTF